VSTQVEQPAAPLGVTSSAAGSLEDVKARGYWELVWTRFKKDKLAVTGGFYIIFLFLAAFAGGPIAAHLLGHSPNQSYLQSINTVTGVPAGFWTRVTTEPFPGAPGPWPHALFILGADGPDGRDLFLRLLYGAQTSLYVAVLATFGSVAIGVIAGLAAGYLRGWVDTLLSRLIEIVMVFPFLLFVIALKIVAGPQLNSITLGFLPQGVFTLAMIFSVFGWFYPARIMRGVVFSLREKEFVEAARMTGASDWRIMRSHLLPHLVAPIVVYSSLIVATNIIGEAGLSFLGLGIDPTKSASWGNILAAAPDYVTLDPWLMFWPGICILLTTLAFNLLGDGLRDAFDPRARI
jgi:ABC-type dipeptide/oligopeptide/nickel transport system permease subunit